ncbi:hypothetical protein [Sphingobacterium sp.]|uniref:hypothetical protein n=1 Tax=Sphingobacterium sp. TaxID=341027 RepID=UPI00289933A1|nr:hypothetical protein [Sphingobacterium sp.]
MKNKYYLPISILSTGLLMTGLLMNSCKKTTYEQIKRPYNDLLSFKIASSVDGLDSLNAVIAGDSISIFWDPAQALPTTISPALAVSAGATVSPASGQAVPFSTNTQYTVTAEDGSTKTYRVRPVFNIPIPTITKFSTTASTVAWGQTLLNSFQILNAPYPSGFYYFAGTDQTAEMLDMYYSRGATKVQLPLETFVEKHKITIDGEYFLTGQGGSDDFRVFIKRLKDGFEVESDIESVTENKIISAFPKYSSVQDTGAHQLFLQINGRTFEGEKIQISAPGAGYLRGDFKFQELGQPLKLGAEVTLSFDNIRDDYDGKVVEYYDLKKMQSVEYIFSLPGSSAIANMNIRAADLTIEGNKIKHKVTQGMLNSPSLPLVAISFVYPYADRRGRTGYTTTKKIFPMPSGTYITTAK